ncbi:hypothetical protein [Ensifer adhaerens]|uniref:hypothetical protein n=1 Tax=Ensifer adhaerens TaxID=106592 RepID=UPI00098F9833|nr:hypothetical protein [Ensifer adhaerens]
MSDAGEFLELIDNVVPGAEFGWINALFNSIVDAYPGLNFNQQRRAFFVILKRLLEDGRIKFLAPGADVYINPENRTPRWSVNDAEAQWDASIEEIIEYLEEKWPREATDKDDLALVTYFLKSPVLFGEMKMVHIGVHSGLGCS